METLRGPKVRRRSRTDSGSGQLIVPPRRVLFTVGINQNLESGKQPKSQHREWEKNPPPKEKKTSKTSDNHN